MTMESKILGGVSFYIFMIVYVRFNLKCIAVSQTFHKYCTVSVYNIVCIFNEAFCDSKR